mgnify:CR=1 FL=1
MPSCLMVLLIWKFSDDFLKLKNLFVGLRNISKQLNQEIFETLYFAAVTASMEEAKVDGPYESYKGSPISGISISAL